MADPLPRNIVAGPEQLLPVVEKSLNGKLGYFDMKTGEIGIETNQHQVGKHHILLHEMLHLAAIKVKQTGLVKRQPSEDFVTYLTGALFPMLALSGLWNGVSPEETKEFMEILDANVIS